MFDRRLLTNFDWVLLALVVCITLLGVANLYSATAAWSKGGVSIYAKQGAWFGVGLGLSLLVCSVDYRRLQHASPFLLCWQPCSARLGADFRQNHYGGTALG